MLPLLLAMITSATTWQPLPPNGSSLIVTLHARHDTLVACGVGGCASSADGGASWKRPDDYAVPEGVPVQSEDRIAMIEEGRVHVSTDLGANWTEWNEGIPADQEVEGVALRGGQAFAAASKVHRSPGMTSFSDTCTWYVRGASDPGWKSLGWARSYSPDQVRIGHGGTLFRTLLPPSEYGSSSAVETSRDTGRTWDTIRTAANLLHIDDATYVVAFSAKDSALLSLDSGRTWEPVFGTLYKENFLDGAVLLDGDTTWRDLRSRSPRHFALDSLGAIRAWCRIGSRLWANGNHGLFSSLDSGVTWTRADATFPLGLGPALRWRDGALHAVLQSYRYQAVARSDDGGSRWTRQTGWLRGVDELEDCPDGLMATTSTGTLVVNGTAELVASTTPPDDITCTKSGAYGLQDGELTLWSGTGWSLFDGANLENATQIAATPSGFFAVVDDYENDLMRLAFLPDGLGSGSSASLDAYVKSIEESPRGAWVSTARGLHLCRSASDCRAVNPAGTDSLWWFASTSVQGPFVLASGAPYGDDLVIRYRQARLFASADSGNTWASFPLPTLARDAAVTSTGIVANLYGAGLWRLDSDVFHVTGTRTRATRTSAPTLVARGRILTLSGIVAGARLRVLDASGRAILDVHPEIRDGQAAVQLPTAASGVLFAELRSGQARTGFHWVANGR